MKSTEAASASQCPVQSWYSKPCFVWTASLPELWLRMVACLAPFTLSAGLLLAHLTSVVAFLNCSSEAPSGRSCPPCLPGLGYNLPNCIHQHWDGQRREEEAPEAWETSRSGR